MNSRNNELASFWNVVQYLVSEGEIIDGADFNIKYTRKFNSKIVNAEFKSTRPILYLQKSRIFMLYKRNGKAVGDDILPEGSLKYYLENSKAFLGEKTSRFFVYYKGIPQYDRKNKNPDGSLVNQTTVQRAYCFDYLELVKSFGVNFEKNKLDDADLEEDEDENVQYKLDL